MPTEPLTMDEMERILRDVSLGVPPPENESEEARAFRAQVKADIEEHRANGIQNDIPWNG